MKRITTMLMAAVMLIGTAGLAGAAVEFKASGHMHLLFGAADNAFDEDAGFNKEAAEDNFYVSQRFRPKLTMKADGVTAVFEAQQHQAAWGSNWPVGGNPNVDIRIRQAYIDFKLPSTPVNLKVGYQQLSLPSIWGHPVFDARVGGVVANIPFSDEVALTAFWARPTDKMAFEANNGTDDVTLDADPSHNAADLFGAMLPLNFDGVKATPYVMYGRIGNTTVLDNGIGTVRLDSGVTDMLIVGGVNVEIMPMDALSVKIDAIATNYSSDIDDEDIGLGFMVAAAVDYELPWGTPGLFLWYATGADDEGEGAFYAGPTDGFGPTSWGFEGYNTFDLGAQVGTSGSSTAGVGLQVADISLIDGLKHTARVAYIMGTGDDSRGSIPHGGTWDAWTSEDSFIEINFDSNWSIYENLAAVVELGALLPDFGSDTKTADFQDDLAWRAQLTLRFSF